jgi:hypothetical protein
MRPLSCAAARFATLADVIGHSNEHFKPGLAKEVKDLAESLKSL